MSRNKTGQGWSAWDAHCRTRTHCNFRVHASSPVLGKLQVEADPHAALAVANYRAREPCYKQLTHHETASTPPSTYQVATGALARAGCTHTQLRTANVGCFLCSSCCCGPDMELQEVAAPHCLAADAIGGHNLFVPTLSTLQQGHPHHAHNCSQLARRCFTCRAILHTSP
jgi:hypothetical protein